MREDIQKMLDLNSKVKKLCKYKYDSTPIKRQKLLEQAKRHVPTIYYLQKIDFNIMSQVKSRQMKNGKNRNAEVTILTSDNSNLK